MTRSIPLLIVLGLVLYVDRIVRREVILDSSALVATMFVAHVLNVCRSSIAHVDSVEPPLLLSQPPPPVYWMGAGSSSNNHYAMQQQARQAGLKELIDSNNGTAVASSNSWSSSSPSLWWQEGMVYLAYTLASIMLLMDVDVVGMILPTNPQQQQQQKRRNKHMPPQMSLIQLACSCRHEPFYLPERNPSISMMQPMPVRISTVVAHCILVGAVLQMGVHQAFMTPARIMARSFSFACLSVCWTYVAGES